MSHTDTTETADQNVTNRQPLGGAAVADHPVGLVLGAALGGVAGGAAAGAVAGTVVGPVGTAIGAVVGAIAGGLVGSGVAELVDPAAEDSYWRENYRDRPYTSGGAYDDFGPAYGYGVNAYTANRGRRFEDVEDDLSDNWDSARGTSRLDWQGARLATRDAWDRLSDKVERAVPGDSDRDGK